MGGRQVVRPEEGPAGRSTHWSRWKSSPNFN